MGDVAMRDLRKEMPVKLSWGQGRQEEKQTPVNVGDGCAIPELAEHCAASGRKLGCRQAKGRCIRQLSISNRAFPI